MFDRTAHLVAERVDLHGHPFVEYRVYADADTAQDDRELAHVAGYVDENDPSTWRLWAIRRAVAKGYTVFEGDTNVTAAATENGEA